MRISRVITKIQQQNRRSWTARPMSALMNLINLKRRSQTAIGVIIIDNIIIINASDFSMLYMTQKLQFIDGL